MSTMTMKSTSITRSLVQPRSRPSVRVAQQRQPIVHIADHDSFAEVMQQGLYLLLFIGFIVMAVGFVAEFLL